MSVSAIAQLGEIADLQAGVGFPVDLQGRSSGEYPVAKVRDISRVGRSGEAVISAADNYIDEGDLARLRARPIPFGSVLFAKIGEAIRQNHRVIAGCSLLIDNNAMAAIPTRRVESRYLYHFLRTVDFYGLASATTVPALRKSQLERLSVPLPLLEEQKRIARILDAADALRAKRREALVQLDTLLQSTFLDMFGHPVTNPMGWDAPPLADFCRTGTGGTPSRRKMQRYYEGGTIPWVKSGDLREGVIVGTDEHLTVTALRETNVKLVPKDALLIALYGATVGRLGILGIQATTNQAVCHIVPNSLKVDLRYMFHSLLNQVPYLVRRGVGGAQPNISQGIVKSLAIPLPPLDLQHHFTTIVGAVEQQKATQRAHLAELDTLFSSIQTRAFRGDL